MNRNKNKNESNDPSITRFIEKLNGLLEEETFDYCFYDFTRQEMKNKNQLYNIIENIRQDHTTLKNFCDVINKQLIEYDIINISNIICGLTYPKRKNQFTSISNGYYYCFTVICRRKGIGIL